MGESGCMRPVTWLRWCPYSLPVFSTEDRHHSDLRHEVDAFEAAATDNTLSSEDFLRLGEATILAAEELPPLTTSEPDVHRGQTLS